MMIPSRFAETITAESRCWTSLVGALVEVQLEGKPYRQGIVELTMPDGSGFWLAAEGAFTREFIQREADFEVSEKSSVQLA